MGTLKHNALSLQLLIPKAKRHTVNKFKRDNSEIRPSNIDNIVEAIYEDIETIASSTGITQSFVSLTDSPNNYTSQTNRITGVNATDDGVEFKTWEISASSLHPGTSGGTIGKSGNEIGKIYFGNSGELDHQGDLKILASGTQKAVFAATTGYLGLGVASPVEPLDSVGGIKIGNAVQSSGGTIRYSGNDFQGYDGTSWKSFLTIANLTNGSGTTANAGAVDLGGLLTADTRIWGNQTLDFGYADASTESWEVGTNALNRFAVVVKPNAPLPNSGGSIHLGVTSYQSTTSYSTTAIETTPGSMSLTGSSMIAGVLRQGYFRTTASGAEFSFPSSIVPTNITTFVIDGTTGSVYTDNSTTNEGIRYGADYSASFVARSLVDKGYVDAAVSGGGGGNTIFTGGTMAADSTIAMANKKVTFSGGNLDQTNSAVINTITGTSAGNFSDSAYYNDTGVRAQFLMGGSTYGVGGNLELINDTFGIRTTDDFPIGSRNGVIKFSLGGDFTNANTRVKFTPTGAIFGAAVGLISAGAELDVRGAAKIATDLTLTTGDITQTNNVVVNTITATSAGSLSEFAYYNDTGIRGQLLMGGSTYGVGGNLELINNSFGIRATDDFPIGSRNGDIKFSLGADFTNANTRAKFTSTGAIFGAAVGLVSAGAELHVKSSGSTSATTALLVQNLLGTDLLEVLDDASIIANGQITQARGSGSIGRKLELSGNPLYYTEDYYSSGMKYDMYHAGSLAARLNANGESIVGSLKSGAIRIPLSSSPMTFDLQDNGLYTVTTAYVSGFMTTWRYAGTDTARIDSNGDSFISGNTGFGTTTPLAKVHIKGPGSTSATTALLVQNTLGTDLLEVKDDGTILGIGDVTLTGGSPHINIGTSTLNPTGHLRLFSDGKSGNFMSSIQGYLDDLVTNTLQYEIGTNGTGVIPHLDLYFYATKRVRISADSNAVNPSFIFGNTGIGYDSSTFSSITKKFQVAGDALIDGNTTLDGNIIAPSLPVYADEAAAIVGGIATDTIYKTSTGELRIKL